MTYSSYIVAGGGRTGSHLIEQVITFITGYPPSTCWEFGDLYNHYVIHTHEIRVLAEVPETIQDRCCLIVSRRKDLFAQAISLVMSRYTNEWFNYTDRQIEPFAVDPKDFGNIMREVIWWNKDFDRLIMPLYKNVVEIFFEDLINHQGHIEDFVAEKIGISNLQGSKSWTTNRNLRNYQQIISNYQDLKWMWTHPLG